MHPPSPILLHFLRRATRLPRPLFRPQSSQASQHLQHLQPLQRIQSQRPSSSTATPLSSKPFQKSTPSKPPRSPSTTAHSPLPTLHQPVLRNNEDRGPPSEEKTTTDFEALNVFGDTLPPSNAIESCYADGFVLDNGIEIRGGAGVLLVQGEAFVWRPWTPAEGKVSINGGTRGDKDAMLNAKGQWSVDQAAWGVLECVWPKPELLILGLGEGIHPVSPQTRKQLERLGVRVDVADTRNAAAMFNMLATERGVRDVAAALVPVGWRGRR